MYLQANTPATGQPVAETKPTNMATATAYAEAYARYKQAWADLRYADMGMAAIDMRDILAKQILPSVHFSPRLDTKSNNPWRLT